MQCSILHGSFDQFIGVPKTYRLSCVKLRATLSHKLKRRQ
jgi:hypothetical protein